MGELREKLAEYAHVAWSGWMKYLFEKCEGDAPAGTLTIPKWAVERWQRQMTAKYEDLPEEEKKSDRDEADRMLEIVLKACHHQTLVRDPLDRGIFCKDCGSFIGLIEMKGSSWEELKERIEERKIKSGELIIHDKCGQRIENCTCEDAEVKWDPKGSGEVTNES